MKHLIWPPSLWAVRYSNRRGGDCGSAAYTASGRRICADGMHPPWYYWLARKRSTFLLTGKTAQLEPVSP